MSDPSKADFTPDPLQARFASPSLAAVAERHGDGGEAPSEFVQAFGDRDTEPNLDAQMLRVLLRAGLK